MNETALAPTLPASTKLGHGPNVGLGNNSPSASPTKATLEGLDTYVESTLLPPGLLDSPPRDNQDGSDANNPVTPIHCFVNNITVPPSAAALSLPQAVLMADNPAAATNTEQQRHCSERLRLAQQAGHTVTGDLAARALAIQLKKWSGKAASMP